jgi:hypothetical protein
VQIRPDGGVGIEIFAIMNIAQYCSFSADDYHRLAFGPIPHLREWVPKVAPIDSGD